MTAIHTNCEFCDEPTENQCKCGLFCCRDHMADERCPDCYRQPGVQNKIPDHRFNDALDWERNDDR